MKHKLTRWAPAVVAFGGAARVAVGTAVVLAVAAVMLVALVLLWSSWVVVSEERMARVRALVRDVRRPPAA